jgi:tRNA nucleotidyltransferase (CCA-adding enzyme)
MKTYLVGGAVRDKLLGYPVTESDWVVVGATPEQLTGLGYRAVGRDFPVFLHPQTKEEYALARTERKTAPGYTGFQCHSSPDVSLEDDLLRRDLTVNAMAMDEDGKLIDPYGGKADLQAKILRHVSPAFAEDPLRVLRVARFAARYAHLGFTVADETLALMRQLSDAGELEFLVAERLWSETDRALAEQSPRVYFDVLRGCGALAVLFPEIDRLFGIPQPEHHHPEIDTGLHCMMALQQAARLNANNCCRFAVLVHDLGKAETARENWPQHINHEKRGVKLIHALCERIKTPKRYRDLAVKVCQYHTHSHLALELKPSTIVKLLDRLDAWRDPEGLDNFLLACTADATGRKGLEDQPYPQSEWLKQAYLVCRQVDSGPLVEAGLSGVKLGNAIRQQRIVAIAKLKTMREAGQHE